jgi:hypothetical protein
MVFHWLSLTLSRLVGKSSSGFQLMIKVRRCHVGTYEVSRKAAFNLLDCVLRWKELNEQYTPKSKREHRDLPAGSCQYEGQDLSSWRNLWNCLAKGVGPKSCQRDSQGIIFSKPMVCIGITVRINRNLMRHLKKRKLMRANSCDSYTSSSNALSGVPDIRTVSVIKCFEARPHTSLSPRIRTVSVIKCF